VALGFLEVAFAHGEFFVSNIIANIISEFGLEFVIGNLDMLSRTFPRDYAILHSFSLYHIGIIIGVSRLPRVGGA